MALTHKQSRRLNGFIFVLPWLIGFFLFFLIPIVNTFIFSFNIVGVADQGGRTLEFIGVKNYVDLFRVELASDNQTQIYRMFYEEFTRIVVNTPLIVIFSLFAAILLNMQFKGRDVVRVIFFLPIVLGLDVVLNLMLMSTGATYMDAQAQSGAFLQADLVERVLLSSGLPTGFVGFLSDSVGRVFELVAKSGVQILTYLAGLQSIDKSLYEVADIEGANRYETFWKITLPMVSPVMMFVTIYTLVDMFLASSLTNEIYTFTILENKIGIGSALSVVYLVFVLLIVGIVSLLFSRVVYKNV
ncbi:MAG: sugar ABC transporter permease [Bacillota bacterium]|jgi:ABC-type sugar transport system permease subunit|nr:sugar ABC transporter permease [Bacillota bacterium]HOB91194.1 sugar ABC transporter permease [Bacillota bacterium]HPZ54321.1 sugar ABC transporter permease [Bacillota bacterium]HQD17604.1 sugar ABC transporter permease [Bacillota bacterium]